MTHPPIHKASNVSWTWSQRLHSPDFFSLPSLLLMVLFVGNNMWAKSMWPGFWTGKISDFAMCLFGPWALRAMAQAFLPSPLSRYFAQAHTLFWTCSIIAGLMIALKTSETASTIHDWGMQALWGVIQITPRPNQVDSTDLWALLGLPVAYFYGRSRIQKKEL
jgi:hypothetical protein